MRIIVRVPRRLARAVKLHAFVTDQSIEAFINATLVEAMTRVPSPPPPRRRSEE